MLVSRKYNFIYIGINKTGTTSIEASLKNYCNRYYQRYLKTKHQFKNNGKPGFKHVPATIARDLVGNGLWKKSFCFTFVRNPWARVVSEYTAHRHDHNKYTSVKEGFTEWVLAGGNWLARENKMCNFVTDDNKEIIVNYIGKLETIEKDIKKITQKIEIDALNISHLNKSKSSVHYREMYTDETRDIVTHWVEEDASMFNYKF